MAFDGRHFLVVWEDARPRGVFGTRVQPDGTILDPAGIPIGFGSGTEGGTPRVAYDGTQFVVVWAGVDGVFGRRVSRDGKVRGPAFEVLEGDDAAGPVGIACARELCLVSFTGLDDENFILARRVRSDGTVLDRDLIDVGPIGSTARGDSAVAWDGRQFLVVWSRESGAETAPDFVDERGGAVAGGADRFFVATRVRHDTRVQDSPPLELSQSAAPQDSPAVAYGKDTYLVVRRELAPDATPMLLAARVETGGDVRDRKGVRLPAGPGAQKPAVAFDGKTFLVVWQEPGPDGSLDIRGARVSASGRLLDMDSLAILTAERAQREPAVAASGEGFLVVWEDERGERFGNFSDIVGTRVSREGTVLEPGGLPHLVRGGDPAAPLGDSRRGPLPRGVGRLPRGAAVLGGD